MRLRFCGRAADGTYPRFRQKSAVPSAPGGCLGRLRSGLFRVRCLRFLPGLHATPPAKGSAVPTPPAIPAPALPKNVPAAAGLAHGEAPPAAPPWGGAADAEGRETSVKPRSRPPPPPPPPRDTPSPGLADDAHPAIIPRTPPLTALTPLPTTARNHIPSLPSPQTHSLLSPVLHPRAHAPLPSLSNNSSVHLPGVHPDKFPNSSAAHRAPLIPNTSS